MSVVSCHLIDESFSFSDRARRYSATYRIKTNDPSDTGVEAAEGAATALPDPLPAPFSTWAIGGISDANAFAQTFSATKRKSIDDARCYHEITVEFYPMEQQDDDWTNDQDPLTRPIRIVPYTEDVEQVVEEGWVEIDLDAIGLSAGDFAVISNAAGKEPGTPLTQPRRLSGLKFIKNVATLAAAQTLRATYENKLNSATFYDAAAKTVLCRFVEVSEPQFAGGSSYHEVAFCTIYREEGWSVPLVNRGYEFINAESELQLAREDDADDQSPLVTEPINLDLDGHRVAAGTVGTSIPWRIQDTVAFSGMGVGG